MPFLMDFETASGMEAPDAFWCVGQLNISPIGRTTLLTFIAYRDQAARDQGLEPLAGGQHSYRIDAEAYDALSSSPATGATLGDVLVANCEDYALACQDTDSGEVGTDGQAIKVSFFEGAERV
jgi:hypothetical protein